MTRAPLFFQFLAALTCLLTVLSSGIHEAWTSVYLPKLLNGTEKITITSDEGSWITISMGIGGLLGTIITIFLTDIFGRKATILMTAFPNFIASVILCYANSVLLFCLARVISGIASGMALAVIPHYFGEIADPKIRGTLGTIVPIFNLIGFIFINVVGNYLTITESSLISSVIPIILILTFIWMPESPYFLIMRQRYEDAKKSLFNLKGKDCVVQEFNRLKDCFTKENGNKGNFLELFTKQSNRRALLIVIILMNGKQLTGIGPIDAYTQLIFAEIFDTISPMVITTIYLSTRLVMVVISSIFADRIGRRPILLVSFFGAAITLLLLSIFLYLKTRTSMNLDQYYFFPIIFLEGFAVFYSFLTSIPSLMLGELFPMNVKVFATIIFELYFYAIMAVVIKLFQITTDTFGMQISFFAFSISCLVHIGLFYKFVVETKEKTLEEIQDCLRNGKIK